MAIKTKANLIVQKNEIKNETTAGANTALRNGTMIEDLLDSLLGIQDDLVNALNSTSTTKALTAAQGKALNDLITTTNANITTIQGQIAAIDALIGVDGDVDSIVNTVTELLAVFQTYSEGMNIATEIAKIGNIGTKAVDETDLADLMILQYDAALNGVGGWKMVAMPETEESTTTWQEKTYASTITFDLAGATKAAFKYTEGGAVTWALSNPPSDATLLGEYLIEVTLASTSHVITLPANFFEEGTVKTEITLSGASGDVKTIQLLKNGSNYEIFYPGETSGTVDDGSITNAKLATDVKAGSLADLTTLWGGVQASITAALLSIWNKIAVNVTVANTTQVLVNIGGVITGFAGFIYDSVTKTLTVSGDGTSSVIEFDQTATSGNSGLKVTPSVANSCKRYDNTRVYDYLDTTNGRIVQLQPVRQEIGGSTIMRTGGSIQSTSATPVVVETITTSTGDTITIETEIDAVVSGAATSTHKKLIGTFKNVAGTVTQIGSTTSVHNVNNSYGDNSATGIAGFNINGTSVEIRFTGLAATTGDVTSYTITKYK